MREPDKGFVLDLDRDRIKTILREAYHICKDFLCTDFSISVNDFVNKIDPYLNSNRVTLTVSLDLPSKKYPGMKIEVNIRRKKVFARMHPPHMQAKLNHMLKVL